jgi:hypothetical protein
MFALLCKEVGAIPRVQGDATTRKLATLMNQGYDNTVRRLLVREYALDSPTAEKVLGHLQGKVEPKMLSPAARARVVQGAIVEGTGPIFKVKMEQAGDTWLQAWYNERAQRVFVVSMEVPARFRRNHLGTDLLGTMLHYVRGSLGPVFTVTGEAGATNLTVLRTPGRTIADTAFAKAMNDLGFDTAYDPGPTS